MDSEIIDQGLSNENKYRFAGYCAIISSFLAIPHLIIHLMCDMQLEPITILLPLNILFTIIGSFCGLYAFYRFKCYLNEYYEFHDIDIYVMPIILLSIMGSTLAIFSQMGPAFKIPSIIAIFAICIAVGIIVILYSVRLLSLPVSLHGMLRPYAYITIAAAICFMLFILGPIGVILGAVTDFMLGVILLKSAEEATVEFV